MIFQTSHNHMLLGEKRKILASETCFANKVKIMLLGRRNLTCEFTPNRRKMFIDNVRNM